ncbi:MAG: class I SAM-dependent methyltransferase [Deferribacteraceae bacterium]|jgi:SAM-dependent methyltransferase|nr:class I SAM-dependent methyltransferase [Deferribacteraceae bacterium]
MTEYDRLAWFYNKYWTQDAPALFERTLDRVVLSRLPNKAEILDLCCGTGQMCALLSSRHYKMTGLDNSETMLVIAGENAPAAGFVCADAVKFTFNHQFDGIISLYDSLNHILTHEELLSCFRSVRRALKVGGAFFFDLNSMDAFTSRKWEEGFSAVERNNVCIMKPVYDPFTGLADYNITTFLFEEGVWRREDIQVQERYYSGDKVIELLTQADFHNIQILSGSKDLKMPEFKKRLFFLAT